eukprot:scaffold4887_cov69-Phaeocystis_antarctica.AAC.1
MPRVCVRCPLFVVRALCSSCSIGRMIASVRIKETTGQRGLKLRLRDLGRSVFLGLVPGTPCQVVQCEKRPRTGFATCPSAGRQVRLRGARFDSQGCQVDGRLRPRVEGAG